MGTLVLCILDTQFECYQSGIQKCRPTGTVFILTKCMESVKNYLFLQSYECHWWFIWSNCIFSIIKSQAKNLAPNKLIGTDFFT